MKINEIINNLKDAQSRMEREVFAKPPATMEDFYKRQGFWMGLNESQRIILEAIARGDDD